MVDCHNWSMGLLSKDDTRLKKDNECLKEMINKFKFGKDTRGKCSRNIDY